MRRKLATFTLLAAVACGDPASPYRDFELKASVSATTLTAGQAILVNVVATNRGSETQRIVSMPCQPAFEVTTSDGTTVEQVLHACLAIATNVDLGPGESFTFVSSWKGDARPGPGEANRNVLEASNLLPSGTYILRGKLGTVYSAPVQLEIK